VAAARGPLLPRSGVRAPRDRRATGMGGALGACAKPGPGPGFPEVMPERDYRDLARHAALWIDSTAIPQERGVAWPGDPRDPGSIAVGTYSGNACIVAFLAEALHAQPDP